MNLDLMLTVHLKYSFSIVHHLSCTFKFHSHSESPSAPVNVTISNMTNTSATLSWLPPEYSGGRNISEITYNITYSGVKEADI